MLSTMMSPESDEGREKCIGEEEDIPEGELADMEGEKEACARRGEAESEFDTRENEPIGIIAGDDILICAGES